MKYSKEEFILANIQSSINQIMSLAGIASQLPAGQKIAERGQLKRAEKRLWNEVVAISKSYYPNNLEAVSRGLIPAKKAGEMLPTYNKLAEVKRQQFELNPTVDSWKEAKKASNRAGIYQNISRMQANRMTQSRIDEAVQQRNDLEQRLQRLRAGEDPAYYGPEFNKLSDDKQREVAQQLQTIRTTGGKR